MNKFDITVGQGERLDKINEDLSLIQKIGGLTFGTDAYLLSAFAKKSMQAAELGSGTGVASLLCLTKNKAEHMYSFEIQHSFAELSERNARLNGLDDRMSVIEKDIRSITEADTCGRVDTVISNPPYMKDGSGFVSSTEEMSIARRELNGTVSDFCSAAARLLRFGGLFYTVWRPDRLCDLICALRAASLEPKRMITVYPDSGTKPCLVLTEAKSGASPSLVHSRPLIIYRNGTRTYTDDMQRIYDEFSMEHLFK